MKSSYLPKFKSFPFKLVLPLIIAATAASAVVSANQLFQNSTFEMSVETSAFEKSTIGIDRVHKVALNANGAIEGRIAAIDTDSSQGIADLTVYFMSQGKVVCETTTDNDGTFLVQGLQEGAYSFVATGEKGFAAYGVQVVGEATEDTSNVMEAAAVSPNFAAVKQILVDNLPENVAVEIIDNAIESAPRGANRVKLDNGTLQGNLHTLIGGKQAVQGTTVYLLDGNEKVATVDADENGSFRVGDLEPGIYGFVATGPLGFAAVSFEAVQETGESSEVQPVAAEPIAYQDAISVAVPVENGNFYANSLDVCLTCGNDAGFVDNSMTYDSGYTTEFAPIEYAGENIGYGGACGASCGSCGNYTGFASSGCCGAGTNGFGPLRGGAGGLGGRLGGVGRLGRLALLGGTVVGIVAIADDDDPQASSNPNPN
ncbi:MAG: hypothetical protein AAFN77_05865 [Planctomycetota bacterium]